MKFVNMGNGVAILVTKHDSAFFDGSGNVHNYTALTVVFAHYFKLSRELVCLPCVNSIYGAIIELNFEKLLEKYI